MTAAVSRHTVVDSDFKDCQRYEVFCPEGSSEPWHVAMAVKDKGSYTHWAVMQMLQAKDWDVEFEWAVFMKTWRSKSSGLHHFSKKFTDGATAFKTFADWFYEKTANRWLGDFTTTFQEYSEVDGMYTLLTPEQANSLPESERKLSRSVLISCDVPVDTYFKDRGDYQVYCTKEGHAWCAVMSTKGNRHHAEYAVIQLLAAKPTAEVEFEFVVFMRHGKVGGSAQRYAKRYTNESSALSTFCQWYREKTDNEWSGYNAGDLGAFVPIRGKLCLLKRSEWPNVIDFEEPHNHQLIDSDVQVDHCYRDRHSYRVYMTDDGDLWASVLSRRDEKGSVQRAVVLQLLAKKPDVVAAFDYVVLRRITERGESGQWSAKKFTNELDALRTYRLWYQDETGNQWKGSFMRSYGEFVPVDGKMNLLARQEWATATSIMAADASMSTLESILAESKRSRDVVNSTVPGSKDQSLNRPAKLSIDLLKRALAAEKRRTVPPSVTSPSCADLTASLKTPPISPRGNDRAQQSVRGDTPSSRTTGLSGTESTPVKTASTSKKKTSGGKARDSSTANSEVHDEVDACVEQKDTYKNVIYSAKMLQKEESGKSKFYVMQLLEADPRADVNDNEKYCFFVRTGKLGAAGSSNFRLIGSLETGKKSFVKKFLEKTKNNWWGSYEKTLAQFEKVPGEFELVSSFDV